MPAFIYASTRTCLHQSVIWDVVGMRRRSPDKTKSFTCRLPWGRRHIISGVYVYTVLKQQYRPLAPAQKASARDRDGHFGKFATSMSSCKTSGTPLWWASGAFCWQWELSSGMAKHTNLVIGVACGTPAVPFRELYHKMAEAAEDGERCLPAEQV